MSDSTDRYAVIGHPVEHSRSPDIHRLFARQCGHNISYTLLPAAEDGFQTTATNFFEQGGLGLNVTLPFKQQAAQFADTLTERAQRAGAVNTLMVTKQGVLGDNTDGAGLLADLHNLLERDLTDQSILILGAGGAVRGVVPILLDANPREIIIANRTLAKAQAIANACQGQDNGQDNVSACSLDATPHHAELVINAISSGLSGTMPDLNQAMLTRTRLAYDMLYGKEPTPFMRWARSHHVDLVSDGIGMLVEQAAESFKLWRGVRPRTAPVIAALRSEWAPKQLQ